MVGRARPSGAGDSISKERMVRCREWIVRGGRVTGERMVVVSLLKTYSEKKRGDIPGNPKTHPHKTRMGHLGPSGKTRAKEE
jgi:hypothetical protein